jgi:hypothetical protein
VSVSDSISKSESESVSVPVPVRAEHRGTAEASRSEDNLLEAGIHDVLANLAAERGGKLSADVADRERQHLMRAKDRFGIDALRHGLAEAASRGKPPRYAIAAASNFDPADARNGCRRGARASDAHFRADMAEMAATMREIAESGVVV